MMKKGIVYLLPSAISKGVAKKNLTPELREVLLNTSYFITEHVRESRRFISSLQLGITIEDLNFTELNKRTTPDQIRKLLDPILNGHNLGLLSDAGCPGIADPGADVVSEAHKNGIKVVPLVGPSSILLALMASGLSGQNFRFSGYLPIDKKDLSNRIKKLETQSRNETETQIFIETPYRADKLFQQLISTLNPTTQLTVAKDITGEVERIKTLSVDQWRKQKIIIGKIPTVFLFMAI